MGKDSEYYKNKKKDQKLKLRDLIAQLPSFASDYIYSKELTTQTSTLISYSYDLLTFFRFLSHTNPLCKNLSPDQFSLDLFGQLTSEDIVEYQRYLELNIDADDYHEENKKAIARKMSSLRGLFLYHYQRKNIPDNPMVLVSMPKIKKDKNIIRLDNFEVQSLLNAIKNGNEQMSERQRKYCQKTRQRDLALLTLLVGTGIRVSECRGLDLSDVDLRADTITIVRKGGGQDVLYIGHDVHDVLSDYINGERASMIPAEGNEKALFLSLQGRRMSVDSIENLVKKYSKMVIPNKKITPHKLRSTYGTALYRETGDIRLVADVLGHENINTTIDYYAAIEDEHKKRAANAVDFTRPDSRGEDVPKDE